MRTLVYLAPWLAGGAVIAVWLLQAGPAAVHGLAGASWLLAGLPVLHALRQRTRGVLRWDGQQWSWEAGDRRLVGRAIRRVDWQGALLLEFLPIGGRAVWLWPERRMDPLRWDDLRRALQGPFPANDLPTGEGGPR